MHKPMPRIQDAIGIIIAEIIFISPSGKQSLRLAPYSLKSLIHLYFQCYIYVKYLII